VRVGISKFVELKPETGLQENHKMDSNGHGGGVPNLRKRKKLKTTPVESLSELLEIASCDSRIVVFSGSGLSAQSGC
jgi:hypothetical protein